VAESAKASHAFEAATMYSRFTAPELPRMPENCLSGKTNLCQGDPP